MGEGWGSWYAHPFRVLWAKGFLLLLKKAEGRRKKVEGGGQEAGGRGQEGKGCCHVLAVRSALVYLAIALGYSYSVEFLWGWQKGRSTHRGRPNSK
jgi:hypothetical protein